VQTKLPKNLIFLLRIFLAVADTPNITKAAKKMSISRVTLQNRLKDLEELCGYKLLEFDTHNRYKLTAKAEKWAVKVKHWLRQGEDIMSVSDKHAEEFVNGFSNKHDAPCYYQQHPLNCLWESDTPYLKTMMQSWLSAEGQFNNSELAHVCENAILARQHYDEFIIMGIGGKAAIMDWLGKESCLSAIGIPLSSTAVSTKADDTITDSYRKAILQGAPLYEHVSMELPRPEMGTNVRAYYRRLILPCKLPDQSPMIASVVEISDNITIDDLETMSVN